MKKISTLFAFLSFFYFSASSQNNALSFDGVDDQVTLPTGIVSTLNDFTIEGWVYWKGGGNWQRVFDFGTGTNTNMFLTVNNQDNGNPRFALTTAGTSGEQQITSNIALTPNRWNHIAVTLSGATTTGTMYINGVQVGFNPNMTLRPSSLGSTTNNYLGRSQYADPFFNGNIDEFRIWNIARTEAQINQSMFGVGASATGLVSYYKMDEGSGQTIDDADPAAADGTLGASTASEATDPTWVYSPVRSSANGLAFDGVDDYVNVGPGFSFQTFTIEMWVKPGATQQAYADIIDNNHGTGISWVLQQDGGVHNQYIFGSNGTASPPFNLTADVWQHLAIVVGSGTKTIYINGTAVVTETGLGNNFYNGNESLRLGAWGGGGRHWNGVMDEVRIWNTARTQTEIQNFQNAGLTGTESGLIALYNFNEGVAGSDNAGLTIVPDVTINNYNGTLMNFALSGTTSNFVTGPSITILPLSLSSFTAARQNNAVALAWSTFTEQNTVAFEIERSNDNRRYTSIGNVKAAGNSSTVKTYTFTDMQPFASNNFYRLKTTATDGKVTYSGVVLIKMQSETKMEIHPNPVVSNLNVQFKAVDGKLLIKDVTGRVVKVIAVHQSGIVSTSVDVSSLQSGLYFISSGNETVRFIKQ